VALLNEVSDDIEDGIGGQACLSKEETARIVRCTTAVSYSLTSAP
jgi:hypothetical protein